MDELTIFCPAKINVFLAITGQRADGFHELVSVAVPLDWGDTLTVAAAAAGEFSLTCDDATVPVDETNLVLKAARAFATASGWAGGARFHLAKQVPMGAGLGGGSSDAVGALKALNHLAGNCLDLKTLSSVAAQVGSDCPLFLYEGAVVMRGRGEVIESLPSSARARLAKAKVLLFKPGFGVNTGWAYGALAAVAPGGYLPEEAAEGRLSKWTKDEMATVDALAFNSMEAPAWEKYAALPTLAARLRRDHGIEMHMSGSGSTCFVAMPAETDGDGVVETVKACWGETSLVRSVRLLA